MPNSSFPGCELFAAAKRVRFPEVEARELAVVLASSAEWHLATLEQLLSRKSSSKSDIRRQQEICDRLLFHFYYLDVGPTGLRGRTCHRLEEELQKLRNDPQALAELNERLSRHSSR